MARSVSRRGMLGCSSCQYLVNVYRQPQLMISVPSTPATCSGHYRQSSGIKYTIFNTQNKIRMYRICEISQTVRVTSILYSTRNVVKGKAVPLQAWSGPEGSRKLRFPDFMTTAQDGGRLSALRTGHLYPQEMLLVLISVRG